MDQQRQQVRDDVVGRIIVLDDDKAIEDAVLQEEITRPHSFERGRFEAAIPFDTEVMLPAKFQSDLYERGYKVFNGTRR